MKHMKHIKLFEQFISEGLDYTLADVAEEFDAIKNEEKVFAKYLKAIGAKSAKDAYLAGEIGDDLEEDDFKASGSTDKVADSEVYGDRSGHAYVTLGKINGVPAVKIGDGQGEFIYVGPAGKNKF
jgi:hypothetical protein